MGSDALVVTIPIQIDRRVTPNGRAHWGTKRKLTDAIKAAAKLQTNNAINTRPGQRWDFAPPLTLNYLVARGKGRQPMDDDNIKASLKYVQDGIALALDIDDRHMTIGTVVQVRDEAGTGFVRVAIESTADERQIA